jgi:hypothetical protein
VKAVSLGDTTRQEPYGFSLTARVLSIIAPLRPIFDIGSAPETPRVIFTAAAGGCIEIWRDDPSHSKYARIAL